MSQFKLTDTEAKMTYLAIFLLFQGSILQQGDAAPQVVSAWEPPCVSAMVSCMECEGIIFLYVPPHIKIYMFPP